MLRTLLVEGAFSLKSTVLCSKIILKFQTETLPNLVKIPVTKLNRRKIEGIKDKLVE